MTRLCRVRVYCPECEAGREVLVYKGSYGQGDDPPEVESQECEHDLAQEAQEALNDRWDEEVDARIDRERDREGRHEWDESGE